MPKNNRSKNIALIILAALWAGTMAVTVASSAEHKDSPGTSASARARDYLKAFPPTGMGMVRHVLHLPIQVNESCEKIME